MKIGELAVELVRGSEGVRIEGVQIERFELRSSN